MRSSSLSYTALCLSLGAALPACAQQTLTLSEITLSASGTPVALSRTGASVSVLEAQDLKRAGDTALAAHLARLPGVSISRTGGLGTPTALRIRGLGPAYIGVRVDGIDVSDPSSTQNAYDFGAVSAANLSRIEVLRGSQSALFGSEAIGGVVDITSFRAENEGTEAKASLEAGSANTTNAAASVAMKTERAELAFSATRTSTDGISAYAKGLERDGFLSTNYTFFGAYDVTDSLRLGLNGFSRKAHVHFDSQTADTDETELARLRGLRAFAQAEIAGTTQELAFSRLTTERDYPLGWVENYKGARNQISWSGAWENAGPVSLNWGLDHTRERFALADESGTVKTTAAFAEALWAVSQDLDLSLALRHDDHETFGGQTSARFAAAWRPSEAWILRAVAANGFRAPSLYELYSRFGNRALKAETSRSFELGAEYLFAQGSSLQVTLFNTEINNKISFGANTYEQLPGTTQTRGVELVGNHALSDDWALFGTYTYTDAYALKGSTKTPAARVPRHDLAMGVQGKVSERLAARVSLDRIIGYTDSGLWPAPASPLNNYTVVNASLGYQVNPTTDAWLRVENLFDQDYQTVRNYGQPGRQVFVGLSTKF